MATNYRVVNLDHHNTLPGGVGQPHDRAIVMDLSQLVPHIITGELQPVQVYTGTLAGAHTFVQEGGR